MKYENVAFFTVPYLFSVENARILSLSGAVSDKQNHLPANRNVSSVIANRSVF